MSAVVKTPNPHIVSIQERTRQRWEDFARDTAGHELTVLHAQGLYRHLRMSTPGTGLFSWEVMTWPGRLAIVGDVADGFVFDRDPDMLGFFRLGSARRRGAGQMPEIDMGYWAQKLASEQRECAFELDQQTAMAWIHQEAQDALEDGLIGPQDHEQFLEQAQEATGFQSEDLCALETLMEQNEQVVGTDWPEHSVRALTGQFQIACWALTATVEAWDMHRERLQGQRSC